MKLILPLSALIGMLIVTHPAPLSDPPGRPVPVVSSNPYGVLVHFGETLSPSVIARMLAQVRAAGIGWVRTDFFWHQIEPAPRVFRWERYDAIVRAAKAHSIELLGNLNYSAFWASSDPDGENDKYPPLKLEDFVRYVDYTVTRYREAVFYWQVWNEPDHSEFWRGSAHEYLTLLRATYRAIKSANPGAQVVLGGLAQGGPSYDPTFLDRVLRECGVGAGECFDIMDFHTNFRSMRRIDAQFRENRRILAKHGVKKPIWITETSYTSDPRRQTLAGYRDGEGGQARYVVDAVSLSLTLGAERVFWYTMYDYENREGEYAASGLVRADFNPKPSYEAYRALTQGSKKAVPRLRPQ